MRRRMAWGAGYILVAVIGALAAAGTGVVLRGPGASAGEVRTQQEFTAP